MCVPTFFYPRLVLRNCSYNQLKRCAAIEAPERPLLDSQYLIATAESRSHTFLYSSHSLTSRSQSPAMDGHSYEADMSGEMTNLDIPCDAPCALEFVPRLSLLTSSLTIVSLQANSAQCSTTRVGTVSIAGYRSRFSV